MRLIWLHRLPLLMEALETVENQERIERVFQFTCEVLVPAIDNVRTMSVAEYLPKWDRYLADNVDMLAPSTWQDATGVDWKVRRTDFIFNSQEGKFTQHLHLEDAKGNYAGYQIFEGTCDDGKVT